MRWPWQGRRQHRENVEEARRRLEQLEARQHRIDQLEAELRRRREANRFTESVRQAFGGKA